MLTPMPTANHEADLDVVLPQPEIVMVNGKPLTITHMPFIKWRKAFRYISEIAAMLGYDLNAKETDVGTLTEEAAKLDTPSVKQRIMTALMRDDSDVIYEFLAFAINKPVEYFNDVGDEAVDIALKVVKVNLNFFCQRLLPRLLDNTGELTKLAQDASMQVNAIRTNMPNFSAR